MRQTSKSLILQRSERGSAAARQWANQIRTLPTRPCLSSIILSPLNGNVKMSSHETGDMPVEFRGSAAEARIAAGRAAGRRLRTRRRIRCRRPLVRAAMGSGMRFTRVSRKCAATNEVARSCASSTSQSETTLRAEKCFRTIPRRGRGSLVSSCTRSPGC